MGDQISDVVRQTMAVRRFAFAVLAALSLVLPARAQVNFPITMPANSVYGSLFMAGPGYAISLPQLMGQMAPTFLMAPNTWNALQTYPQGIQVSGACTGQLACVTSLPTGNQAAWFSDQSLSGTMGITSLAQLEMR
jgi:hypothetical protein